MQDDVDEVKRMLAHTHSLEAIIELLVNLRSKGSLSVDDNGWALWNICDCYAMLRDAKNQYVYQLAFYEWSRASLLPWRNHWVVSDATQAMTLIQGGYGDAWWEWYQFANKSVPLIQENRTVRFESHRANAAAYTRFQEGERAATALQAIETLLLEDQTWINRDFATVTFETLLIQFHNAQRQSEQVDAHVERLDGYLKEWMGRFRKPAVMTEQPILGSWEQLNADRPPEVIFVAIHNAACALVAAKYCIEAERLFHIVLKERREGMTPYSQSLYLLACWSNRHNKEEIRDLLLGFQGLSLQQVLKFAPELSDGLVE